MRKRLNQSNTAVWMIFVQICALLFAITDTNLSKQIASALTMHQTHYESRHCWKDADHDVTWSKGKKFVHHHHDEEGSEKVEEKDPSILKDTPPFFLLFVACISPRYTRAKIEALLLSQAQLQGWPKSKPFSYPDRQKYILFQVFRT